MTVILISGKEQEQVRRHALRARLNIHQALPLLEELMIVLIPSLIE